MSHQPSVTDTEPRHGVLLNRVADDGRHSHVPETTLGTSRSTKAPVTRTTVNDVTDDSITVDDPEFGRRVWTYIRNQLLRLQGMNVQ